MAKQTAADGHFVKHAVGRPNKETRDSAFTKHIREANMCTRTSNVSRRFP
jgi:hypothetical protein